MSGLVTSLTTAGDFAAAFGITDRAARQAFAEAAQGRAWRGHYLPVIEVGGQRGGRCGARLALRLDLCSDELREKLGLPSSLVEMPVEGGVKARPKDGQIAAARDKLRTIEPILKTARGSLERAEAFREVAAQHHTIGGTLKRVAERTLRDWIKAAETNLAELVPSDRSDKGQHREHITRRWRVGCGLANDVQCEITAELEGIARALLGKKGRTDRNTAKLCTVELQRLTAAAGLRLPKAQMKELCEVPPRWVNRFAEMKPVSQKALNNKRFTDKHEFHVRGRLTDRPMEVLMGDVHTVDVTIGGRPMKAWEIGWMDGSSEYLWATTVLTPPDKAITQQDVAISLYDVLTCPWGGMPDEFRIDNGGEFNFLVEAVLRFAKLAEQTGPRVVRCLPHSPEGKARLERAFGQLEQTYISALPGYNGGNPLKPRLKGRGKPVDPYRGSASDFVADMARALAQRNGTEQGGDLQGSSPKGMLEVKIAATGWHAQVVGDLMFDHVFSREKLRDVRQGNVTIDGRTYSGNVLAELIGEKDVPILVPYRDPTGPVLILHEGELHRLTHDTFVLNDPAGAVRKGEMVRLQNEELKRREAKAAPNVDVPELLSAGADLGPVQHNPPDRWSVGVIDKGGFLTKPVSAREAREREDEEDRAFLYENILGFSEGPAAATAGPSGAT